MIKAFPSISGMKPKVIEQPGKTIRQILGKSDPLGRDTCGRDKCPLKHMKNGCRDLCHTGNINYRYDCLKCDNYIYKKVEAGEDLDEEFMKGVYFGESFFSPYVRHEGHSDHLKSTQGSFMRDHSRVCMGRNQSDGWVKESDFKMTLYSRDRDSLRRGYCESHGEGFGKLQNGVIRGDYNRTKQD